MGEGNVPSTIHSVSARRATVSANLAINGSAFHEEIAWMQKYVRGVEWNPPARTPDEEADVEPTPTAAELR